MDIYDLPMLKLAAPIAPVGALGAIVCPKCGDDHSHWHGVAAPYESDVFVTSPSVRLPFWCEDGHEFDVILHFSQGHTLARARHVPEREGVRQRPMF